MNYKEIEKLEKENIKELESKVSFVCKQYDELKAEYNAVIKENNKLKSELDRLFESYTRLGVSYDTVKEKNKKLKEELQRYKEMWDAGEDAIVINIDKDGKVTGNTKRYTEC